MNKIELRKELTVDVKWKGCCELGSLQIQVLLL